MPFPPSPREEYEHNPLEEVICQFRFPTILKINTSSPAEFQDRIRKRYPLYEQAGELESQLPKALSDLLSQLNAPDMLRQFSSSMRHKFSTPDEKRSIVLMQNFWAVTETDYKRWRPLRDEIVFIEEVFNEIYEPEFYSRIGLRYRDVIRRSEMRVKEVDWHELLNPELAGFLGDKTNAPYVRRTMCRIEMEAPEVPGASMTLQHGLVPAQDDQESSYLIDIDLYTTKRSSSQDAYEALDKFNSIAGDIFRWAIRDRLREAMGPRPLDN